MKQYGCIVDRVQAIASGFGVTDQPAYELLLHNNWQNFKPLVLLQNLQSCCALVRFSLGKKSAKIVLVIKLKKQLMLV
jgi:hypothetical protein